MKRLFLGTFINREIFDKYLNGIKEDYSEYINAKWVEEYNIHFTYKFLGDTEDEKIPEIKSALNNILGEHIATLSFSGLGAFPDKQNPRVLFAGMYNPGGMVFKIFNDIEENLSLIGFEKEKRRFKPHITLCRVKAVNQNPIDIFDKYRDTEFGKMNAFDVSLVESTLTNKGPVYKII